MASIVLDSSRRYSHRLHHPPNGIHDQVPCIWSNWLRYHLVRRHGAHVVSRDCVQSSPLSLTLQLIGPSFSDTELPRWSILPHA